MTAVRLLVTTLLCAIFAAVVCAGALAWGVARVAADGDAVVAAVHEAGVSEAIARDPVVAEVVPRSWLDATLRRVHATAWAAVRGASATDRLELRPLKADLRRALRELHQRTDAACARVACAAQPDWARGAAEIDGIA